MNVLKSRFILVTNSIMALLVSVLMFSNVALAQANDLRTGNTQPDNTVVTSETGPICINNANENSDDNCGTYEIVPVPPTPVVPVPPVVTPSLPTTPIFCVDGSDQHKLVVTSIAKDTVAVSTKHAFPICKKVDICFSSYTMPDSYNGQPFAGNPTATPQYVFDSTCVTLPKGFNSNVQLTVGLPDACKNIQVDVYYAPILPVVGPGGHGSQIIQGHIFAKEHECVTNGGGMGGGLLPVVPTNTDVTSQLPATLPTTGASTYQPLMVSLVAAVVAYVLALAYQKRKLIEEF